MITVRAFSMFPWRLTLTTGSKIIYATDELPMIDGVQSQIVFELRTSISKDQTSKYS